MWVRLPLDGNFHLLSLDGEWHATICPHFEAGSDGFTDACQGFLPRFSLADATGDGWALGDPNAVFVTFKGSEEFHVGDATLRFRFSEDSVFSRAGGW